MNKPTGFASVEAMVYAAPPGSSRSTITSSIFNICLFRIICIPMVSFTWGSQAVYKQFNLSSLILCWKACSRSDHPSCQPAIHHCVGFQTRASFSAMGGVPCTQSQSSFIVFLQTLLEKHLCLGVNNIKRNCNLENWWIAEVMRLLPVTSASNTLLNLLYPTTDSLLLLLLGH